MPTTIRIQHPFAFLAVAITVVAVILAVIGFSVSTPQSVVAVPEPQPVASVAILTPAPTAIPTTVPASAPAAVPTPQPTFAPPSSDTYIVDPEFYRSAVEVPSSVGGGPNGSETDAVAMNLPVGAKIVAPFGGELVTDSVATLGNGQKYNALFVDQGGTVRMYVFFSSGFKTEPRGHVSSGQTIAVVEEFQAVKLVPGKNVFIGFVRYNTNTKQWDVDRSIMARYFTPSAN